MESQLILFALNLSARGNGKGYWYVKTTPKRFQRTTIYCGLEAEDVLHFEMTMGADKEAV